MKIILLVPGFLIGIGIFVFLPLLLAVIIMGFIGLANKNYSPFKRWGKYLLWDVGSIFVLVTIWGLVSIITKI